MKVGFAWVAGSLILTSLGCSTRSEPEPTPRVAYRGPDVTIDVRPANPRSTGRAQVFENAAPPTPREQPIPVRKVAPKPASPKPKVRPAPPKPALPPDEVFYPDGRSSRRKASDEFDPGIYRVPDDDRDPAGDPGDPTQWGSYRVPPKKGASKVDGY